MVINSCGWICREMALLGIELVCNLKPPSNKQLIFPGSQTDGKFFKIHSNYKNLAKKSRRLPKGHCYVSKLIIEYRLSLLCGLIWCADGDPTTISICAKHQLMIDTLTGHVKTNDLGKKALLSVIKNGI